MESSKSSVGVELEFLVAIAEADQELNVPEMLENSIGVPIVLPPGVRNYSARANDIARRRGEETIANAIANCPGTRVVQSEEETISNPEAIHLRYHIEWSCGSDSSVSLPPDLQRQRYMNEYRWYAVEIASPALWPTAESWASIREVVQAFKDEYWIITPPSAGMHFHYGNGIDYIPFFKLRRMAALLVAVDPIMVQLHPNHRKVDEYCLSNRLYSRIAHGTSAAATSRELGAEYVEAEPEFPGVRRQPKPVARPFRRRTPNLIVPFKRGQLEGYSLDKMFNHYWRDSTYDYDGINDPDQRPLEIPLAVREILRCTNSVTVAELMRYSPLPMDRPAYSFLAYTLLNYKQMLTTNGIVDVDYQRKRTVEFRQYASEMDPDCVVAHGKVVVRLCEIAADMDLEELWQVALDCDVAEVNGNWYDVFDLLADFGLEEEAKVIQYSVARFRGETVPDNIVEDDGEAEAEAAARQRPSWSRWLSRGSN
ncbi:hypothetical protein F4680DRAFT_463907 [Xylaria scruposa]|nr:hypothetical protein F4680DRAFT_463907 [Xylaria scruposa]